MTNREHALELHKWAHGLYWLTRDTLRRQTNTAGNAAHGADYRARWVEFTRYWVPLNAEEVVGHFRCEPRCANCGQAHKRDHVGPEYKCIYSAGTYVWMGEL